MERTGHLIEFIIKIIFAIFSAIAIVFVVRNCTFMFGFLTVTNEDSLVFYKTLSETHIGKIYNSFGSLNEINFSIILKGFVSFITNMDFICYVYVFLLIALLIVFFTFPKWDMVKSYIKISLYILLSYLAKYVFILLALAICFDGSEPSVYLSLKIGTIFYYIISFIEMFLLSLLICKFVLNLKSDIRYINNHC